MEGGKVRTFVVLAAAALSAGLLVVAGSPEPDVRNDRVTPDARSGSYLRSDGIPDPATLACSTSRFPQNEPSVAIDPRNPSVVVVGANESCTAIASTPVWAGMYRSADGGRTWRASLVPGYPGDTSVAGRRLPGRENCFEGSDPAQAFDDRGRLFFTFLCFRTLPRGPTPFRDAILVARYGADGSRYLGAALVFSSDELNFEDKPAVATDTTSGPFSGSVYVAWSDIIAGCPTVSFARSTDHGATFTNIPETPSTPICGSLADIGVGPEGRVYVAFRSEQDMWVARSLDGGQPFDDPVHVARFRPFASTDFGGRECGDGLTHCRVPYTYPRFDTYPAIAVDESGIHVAWSERMPDGQARIMVATSPDGAHFSSAIAVDPTPVGHQWFPDLASAGGMLNLLFYDSRFDAGYGPRIPPGNLAGGGSSEGAVHVMLARSIDGGRRWETTTLTTMPSNPNLELRSGAREPFVGDYISISAVKGGGYAVWTDSRDIVLGRDRREPGGNEHDAGFEVFLPCDWSPMDITAPSYERPSSTDPCLRRGGLDQNIYGAPLPPP
jgi:hypothetical protein